MPAQLEGGSHPPQKELMNFLLRLKKSILRVFTPAAPLSLVQEDTVEMTRNTLPSLDIDNGEPLDDEDFDLDKNHAEKSDAISKELEEKRELIGNYFKSIFATIDKLLSEETGVESVMEEMRKISDLGDRFDTSNYREPLPDGTKPPEEITYLDNVHIIEHRPHHTWYKSLGPARPYSREARYAGISYSREELAVKIQNGVSVLVLKLNPEDGWYSCEISIEKPVSFPDMERLSVQMEPVVESMPLKLKVTRNGTFPAQYIASYYEPREESVPDSLNREIGTLIIVNRGNQQTTFRAHFFGDDKISWDKQVGNKFVPDNQPPEFIFENGILTFSYPSYNEERSQLPAVVDPIPFIDSLIKPFIEALRSGRQLSQ